MKRHLFLLTMVGILISASQAWACDECRGVPMTKDSQRYPDAPIREYTINIGLTTLSPAGRAVEAMTLNGSIPGPILRFKEGEVARVHVNNHLKNEDTSIHWHGLLVPNSEDGVPYITTKPIPPGGSRTFEFLLRQTGTYWYHSHTDLQEQRGVYGAIVIDPKDNTPVRTDIPKIDREEVVVLSDWTNESPAQVLRTLVRGSNWYALRKGTAQSILGAYKSGHLKDYFDREKALLPPMDVSDVAYDAFLANGQKSFSIPGKPGETVKLRVINAGASTYFYLASATGPLTIIAADGQDIKPIQQKQLLIGMAETYDLIVRIPTEGKWEIRATSQDNSGYTSIFIGDGQLKSAPPPGPLNPYNMNAAMSAILDQLDYDSSLSDEEALANENERPLPPYQRLQATHVTALPKDAPIDEITLKLTGDMMRYVWSINGKTMRQDSTIKIKKGEVVRITLVNNTMMHHPMHLHGHFFRLLMPNGPNPNFSPLKHTVDVPPMSRRVIEFYANEEKDWLFHCHLLYHHKSGMARIFSYITPAEPETSSNNSPKATASSKPEMGEKNDHMKDHGFLLVDGTLQSQMTMGTFTWQRSVDNLNFNWSEGWGRVEKTEYEHELTYSKYFSPKWSALGGYRWTNKGESDNGAIFGVTRTLPYFIYLTGRIQSNGEIRISANKKLQLTNRLYANLRAEYDTELKLMYTAGLGYTLTKNLTLAASYDSDYGLGAGINFSF